MSVKQKQEKPFPHATITATACNYPQDIEFRFLMCSAGSFLNLVYFAVFRYLKYLKKKTEFPYPLENWLHYLAQISVLGFYFAVATIDAKGTTSIHGPGAVFFFVVLFIALGYVSYILKEIREWYAPSVRNISCVVKMAFFYYLVGVAIYCLIGLILESREN